MGLHQHFCCINIFIGPYCEVLRSKCISVYQHFWAMVVFYEGYQQDSAFESFVDLDQQFSALVIYANA